MDCLGQVTILRCKAEVCQALLQHCTGVGVNRLEHHKIWVFLPSWSSQHAIQRHKQSNPCFRNDLNSLKDETSDDIWWQNHVSNDEEEQHGKHVEGLFFCNFAIIFVSQNGFATFRWLYEICSPPFLIAAFASPVTWHRHRWRVAWQLPLPVFHWPHMHHPDGQ